MGEGDRAFGEALRKAREDAGLELGDLARTTKIQVRYLAALEDEDWNGLPSGFIARGFVKLVAREVGAPGDELVELYKKARSTEREEASYVLPEPERNVPIRGDRRMPPAVLAVLFLVGAGVGLWIWSPWTLDTSPPVTPGSSENAPSPPRPAAPPPETVEEAVQEPVEEVGEEVVQEVVQEVEVADEEEPTERAEPEPPAVETPPVLRLEVQAVERTWVRIVADDGKAEERILRPAERRAYEAVQGFTVKLGNAGGVRLFWNGEALKVPGEPGSVLTLSFPEALETLRP